MNRSDKTYLINKEESDSIIVNNNLQFYRYNTGIGFKGFYKFNEDSTGLVCDPLGSFVGPCRRDLKELHVIELTETSLIVLYHNGMEGRIY